MASEYRTRAAMMAPLLEYFEDFDKSKEHLVCVGIRNGVIYIKTKDGHYARMIGEERNTAECCDKQIFKLVPVKKGDYMKFGEIAGVSNGNESDSDEDGNEEEDEYFKMDDRPLSPSAKSSTRCKVRHGQDHVNDHEPPSREFAETLGIRWACTLAIALYPVGESPAKVIQSVYQRWPLMIAAKETDYVKSLCGYLTKFQTKARKTKRTHIDALIDRAGKDSLDKFVAHLLDHPKYWEKPKYKLVNIRQGSIFLAIEGSANSTKDTSGSTTVSSNKGAGVKRSKDEIGFFSFRKKKSSDEEWTPEKLERKVIPKTQISKVGKNLDSSNSGSKKIPGSGSKSKLKSVAKGVNNVGASSSKDMGVVYVDDISGEPVPPGSEKELKKKRKKTFSENSFRDNVDMVPESPPTVPAVSSLLKEGSTNGENLVGRPMSILSIQTYPNRYSLSPLLPYGQQEKIESVPLGSSELITSSTGLVSGGIFTPPSMSSTRIRTPIGSPFTRLTTSPAYSATKVVVEFDRDSGAGFSNFGPDNTDARSDGSIPSFQVQRDPLGAYESDVNNARNCLKLPFGKLDGEDGLLVILEDTYMFDLMKPDEMEEYLSHAENYGVKKSEARMVLRNLKKDLANGLI